jgi:hypothetical protein
MTTITAHDRRILAAYLTHQNRATLQQQHAPGTVIRALTLCGGRRREAGRLVAIYDQLSALPVGELSPLRARPGRTTAWKQQVAA